MITTNCAVLGVALTNVQNGYYDNMSTGMGLLTGVINGFATAVGFLVSIVLMAGIREKIEYDTSKPQYIETIWGVGYRFKV